MDRWSGGGEVCALGSTFGGTKVVLATRGEAGKGHKVVQHQQGCSGAIGSCIRRRCPGGALKGLFLGC